MAAPLDVCVPVPLVVLENLFQFIKQMAALNLKQELESRLIRPLYSKAIIKDSNFNYEVCSHLTLLLIFSALQISLYQHSQPLASHWETVR